MDARKETTTRAAHGRSDERKAADARLPGLVQSPSHFESYPLVGRMLDRVGPWLLMIILPFFRLCTLPDGIRYHIPNLDYIQINASITSGTPLENRLCFLGDVLFCGLSRQRQTQFEANPPGDHTSPER